eukprot:6444481-Amphidinium_carterae.1
MALQSVGLSPILIVAVLKLLYGRWISLQFQGVQAADIECQRGLGQGHAESPNLFCLSLRYLLRPIWLSWERGPLPFTLLTGMDDGLIFDTSLDALLRRVRQARDALQLGGLALNLSKCAILSNTDFQHATVQFDGLDIPVVRSIKFFGVTLGPKGDEDSTVRLRGDAG